MHLLGLHSSLSCLCVTAAESWMRASDCCGHSGCQELNNWLSSQNLMRLSPPPSSTYPNTGNLAAQHCCAQFLFLFLSFCDTGDWSQCLLTEAFSLQSQSFFISDFETRSLLCCWVVQAGHKLAVFLSQPPRVLGLHTCAIPPSYVDFTSAPKEGWRHIWSPLDVEESCSILRTCWFMAGMEGSEKVSYFPKVLSRRIGILNF